MGAAAAAAAAAPGCVGTWQANSHHVRVTNNCGSQQRVKVVIAFGPDGPCSTYARWQSRDWTWGGIGRFDGLQSC